MLQNRKGFTLIELLIVVVIIGILAAVAIPRFADSRERAYVAAMQSDLKQVQTQQEIYYGDPNNSYQYWGGNIADGTNDLNVNPSAGVTIAVEDIEGPPAGWFARAEHEATDQVCEVFFGVDTHANATIASSPGVIACAAQGGGTGGGGATD